jgi:F-type H+-transporting ATPase subunit b
MEKILNEFGVQWPLLIAQVVNFFILLFLLKKFLYQPILKALEVRKQKIAESLKNAQEIELRLQKTESEREAALTKAADEAKKILANAEKSANQVIEDARHKAKNDIEVLILKSEQQIKQERDKMQQEIRNDLANMIAEGLKVITGKVLTEKDKKELISKSLKNLSHK